MTMTLDSKSTGVPALKTSNVRERQRATTAARPLRERGGFRTLAYLFAAVALGGTFWPSPWWGTDQSFMLAASCLVCLLVGISVQSLDAIERWRLRVQTVLLVAAFAYFFSNLLNRGPNHWPYVHLMSAAALLIGLGLRPDRILERWRVPLLLATHAALGIWQIRNTPAPHIDVWVWHNEALRAFLDGVNPYTITMPNIYWTTQYYDPSLVANGRVLTGFQYPPVSLFFALPGFLLGDFRYSMLFAMIVAGACMAYARPGPLSATAMALWLFSPGCFFVLEMGYTEPMLVMLVALTVFCAVRGSHWLFIPLGLLLAGKQYMTPLAAPLVWLLPWQAHCAPSPGRLLLAAIAIAAAVTVPFFLINPKAFFECMVLLQLRQPFRPESLSVLAWWDVHFGERLPQWWCFASLVPTSALALWRCERSAAGFTAALALVSFVFFFLSKQAFGNYYFFTLGVICCSVAVSGARSTTPSYA